MVILKSKKEELHRATVLLANTKSQTTSFVAYDWTTRACKIRHIESPAHLPEYTMTVNHGLFEPSDFTSILAR